MTPTAGYANKDGVTVGFKATEYTADMASHPEGDKTSFHCTSWVVKNCHGLMNESGTPDTMG